MHNTAIQTLLEEKERMEYAASDPTESIDRREQFTARALELDITASYLRMDVSGGFQGLVARIKQWGELRGITGIGAQGTPKGQFNKLIEEIEELRDGLDKGDQHLVIDAIGDSTVVLILLAELIGAPFEACLLAAYDEIKDRGGVMSDGVFVKD